MPSPIPISTYRLQFTPQFGFDHATAIVPYLKALGISHVYASPFLKARAGTTHGYDIIDHTAFNPEFGGEAGFLRMSDALLAADIGLILDFVPNHMAVHGSDNAWWLDVLEWGPRSPYAKFFDIEWQTATGPPRVLLPILGRSYGEVLEAGEIKLRYDSEEGSFSAWYYEHRMPIAPERYSEILQKVVAAAGASELPSGKRLLDVATSYRGPHNPSRDSAFPLKRALSSISGGADIIQRGLVCYEPKDGEPESTHALHSLIERQHYRPAHWRIAQSDINYRRFFDINSLAGLRVEDLDVFSAIHPLVFRLISEGRLQGLRLDHIDGLRDPHQYLRRLQRDAQGKRRSIPVYVVVEKILGEGESLPRFPGVSGTTGYEWLNVISRLFLDPRGLDSLDQAWRETSGDSRRFDQVLRRAKQQVLSTILSSEFTVLARLLTRIAAGHYSTRDYTADRLREALELYVLNFPVYRTYVTATGASPDDRAIINTAINRSRAVWVGSDVSIFDFLQDALTLDLIAPGRARHSITRVRRFALKVQQFTGPMMAKSLEDTAFYRYHRLLALNEVGGEPTVSALLVADFHNCMETRAAKGPQGLTVTATHDTKRGEDARTRIVALTELAGEWRDQISNWRELNRRWIQELPDPRPTAAHEYMLYQALLGAWPITELNSDFTQRVQNFAIKAAREGKEQTNWYSPNERYEDNLKRLVSVLLDQDRAQGFIASFDRFARRCALLGVLNSITQVVLKTTMPGTPDFYQGTELWDLSFVDPDNRRPVNFELRARSLASADERPDWAQLMRDWPSGNIKLSLTRELLRLRNQKSDVFLRGNYRPLVVTGPHRDEIVAYARINNQDAVAVVAGRLFGRATKGGRLLPCSPDWNASVQMAGIRSPLKDVLYDREIESVGSEGLPISDLFRDVPIAVLQSKGSAN
jgi:(1->4)-alpha-D-glucan 1-alpha-D-glucosylmutase